MAEKLESMFPSLTVPGEEGFLPEKMEVIPASAGRSALAPRVCLLGKRGEVYKVYNLPQDWLEKSVQA